MIPHPRHGFTLVEVVVASLIFSVALGAATGTLVRASRTARESDLMERLLWEATGVADSLESVVSMVPGRLDFPDGSRIRWSANRLDIQLAGADSIWVELTLAPALGRLTLGSQR